MATKTVSQNRKHGVHAEIVNVTPKMAAEWLKLNVSNRPIRPQLVSSYARDMAAGAWQLTGESIKFNAAGDLADGQHRLAAVAQSAVAVPMLVVHGVAPESQTVMDSGAKRSGSDALHFYGYKNTALLAAAVRIASSYQAGLIHSAHQADSSMPRPTHSETLGFIESNPDICDATDAVASGPLRRVTSRQAVTVFALWLCSRVDAEFAHAFFSDLAEFRTKGPGDPRHALLSRFQRIKEMRERAGAIEQADAYFRAWNAARAGRPLSKIFAHRESSNNFTVPR